MRKDILKSQIFWLQLVIMFVIGAVVFFASSYFDIFEKLHLYIKEHEGYDLDEIIIVIFFWTLYLFVLLVIRTKLLYERNIRITRLSNALSEQIKSRDRLQSIIAHDLKAPFNSLIGLSDLLIKKNEQLDVKSREKYFEMINKTSRSTYDLLENILHWTSLQTGGLKALFEKKNLKDIVEETVVLLKTVAYKKLIAIELDIQPEIYVFIDDNMIKTVLRNLISNAIKFSEKGSAVKIKSRIDNKHVMITVSDQGIGLDPKKAEDIMNGNFTPELGTENETGTGLGLKICNEFIQLNKGRITISSKKGEGTDFIIFLPRKFDD